MVKATSVVKVVLNDKKTVSRHSEVMDYENGVQQIGIWGGL